MFIHEPRVFSLNIPVLSQKFVLLIMHRVVSVLKPGVSGMHSVREMGECYAAVDVEEDDEGGLNEGSAGSCKGIWSGEDHQHDASEKQTDPKRHGSW